MIAVSDSADFDELIRRIQAELRANRTADVASDSRLEEETARTLRAIRCDVARRASAARFILSVLAPVLSVACLAAAFLLIS